MDCPCEQAVAFHRAQRLGEHLLIDTGDEFTDAGEAELPLLL